MSATLVGTLGSVFALFCLIGNVTGGALFDKIGTLKTMVYIISTFNYSYNRINDVK